MDNLLIATILGFLVLGAAIVSVELGLSVAILEILFGVLAGNFIGMTTTPWIDFLASFASIVLTFLAGAEVDPQLLREKWKVSMLLGGLSFVLPFVGAGAFAFFVAGWDLRQSEIAGVALSTTSLAVVYAVLVETGLTRTEIGKIIMAATFVTDLGTAIALSALFIQPTVYFAVFVAVSIGAIVVMRALQPWFFSRYGDRVIEPEIKGAFAVLFLLMWTAELAQSHAVLPAFLLGLAVAGVFQRYPEEHRRFRVVAFSLLTPFFFFKGGLNVSLAALATAIPLLIGFFVVKIVLKFIGVFPVAMRYVRPHATYTTLLMSTGLTFGTISSLYGLNAGIIDRTQFSVLVTVVILSAVVPTAIAQRLFTPMEHELSPEEVVAIEDEEFEPPRRLEPPLGGRRS
ncbi:MAG TPA: cation:proton antiporter [Candidatus Limnocylindria bacterium]|nr:cation:proton antiporter [Candidatus Limnocylindria bacterium]